MGWRLIWILDDGLLGHLAKVVDASRLDGWTAGRIRAASTTLDAARAKPVPQTQALLRAETTDGRPIVGECLVLHGAADPASEVLIELHPERGSTVHLAEHEAIAWSLVHGGGKSVFVTGDKRAALTALAELGRARVSHAFDVWLDLLELDWVQSEQFEELCALTLRHDQGLERMPSRVQTHFMG